MKNNTDYVKRKMRGKRMENLDVETIRAAVNGEKEALMKVLEYYGPYIEEQAMIEVQQPDGSIRKELDEDLKESLIVALLEAIPEFELPKDEEQ